jgi:hypothetical protein
MIVQTLKSFRDFVACALQALERHARRRELERELVGIKDKLEPGMSLEAQTYWFARYVRVREEYRRLGGKL